MWNRKSSVTLSLAVCFLITALLTAAVCFGPWLVDQYFGSYRGWNTASIGYMQSLFVITFYPCAVFGYAALYNLVRLLLNIRRDDTFVARNVVYLRRISWCCFIVAGITAVSCAFYVPYAMVAVAAGFAGLMLRVVKNVMQSAVEIREENELTI